MCVDGERPVAGSASAGALHPLDGPLWDGGHHHVDYWGVGILGLRCWSREGGDGKEGGDEGGGELHVDVVGML